MMMENKIPEISKNLWVRNVIAKYVLYYLPHISSDLTAQWVNKRKL
jgi:hypothetical protein